MLSDEKRTMRSSVIPSKMSHIARKRILLFNGPLKYTTVWNRFNGNPPPERNVMKIHSHSQTGLNGILINYLNKWILRVFWSGVAVGQYILITSVYNIINLKLMPIMGAVIMKSEPLLGSLLESTETIRDSAMLIVYWSFFRKGEWIFIVFQNGTEIRSCCRRFQWFIPLFYETNLINIITNQQPNNQKGPLGWILRVMTKEIRLWHPSCDQVGVNISNFTIKFMNYS